MFVTAYSLQQHPQHGTGRQNSQQQRHQLLLQQNHLPQPSAIVSQLLLPRRNTQVYSSNGPNENNNNDDIEDDEICVGGSSDNDEECEIDWSKMPGFDDVEVEDATRAQLERQFQMPSSSSSSMPSVTALDVEMNMSSGVADDDSTMVGIPLHDEDIRIASESSNMISDFQRLEMIWQQREASSPDECDVYEPITCGGQTCTTCHGTGQTTCRFCRGTKFLYLPITHDVLLSEGEMKNRDDFEVTQRPPSAKQTPAPKNSSYISCSICHTTGTETCRTCQGSGWIADWTQMGVRIGDATAKSQQQQQQRSSSETSFLE